MSRVARRHMWIVIGHLTLKLAGILLVDAYLVDQKHSGHSGRRLFPEISKGVIQGHRNGHRQIMLESNVSVSSDCLHSY